MKQFITILSFVFLSVQSFSQNGSVKSVAFDTSVNQAVHNATITDFNTKVSLWNAHTGTAFQLWQIKTFSKRSFKSKHRH